jgi:hypothetical protein
LEISEEGKYLQTSKYLGHFWEKQLPTTLD